MTQDRIDEQRTEARVGELPEEAEQPRHEHRDRHQTASHRLEEERTCKKLQPRGPREAQELSFNTWIYQTFKISIKELTNKVYSQNSPKISWRFCKQQHL